MAKTLESYKRTKEGKLVEIYTLESPKGKKIRTKEIKDYSKTREKELLIELKNTLNKKLINYPKLFQKTNKDVETILTGFALTGLGIVANVNVLAIIMGLGTINLVKDTYFDCADVIKINENLLDSSNQEVDIEKEENDYEESYDYKTKILNKKYK